MIDAQNGFGQPAAALAVDSAVADAHIYGVGMAGIVKCGHTGRLGAWSERGAAAGVATLVVSAGSYPPYEVAAHQHASPALWTNPISIAIPGSEPPLVLDMATSMIASGKVEAAIARGDRGPPGVLLRRDGTPTTDPADFLDGGMLLPFGGYKGFGLAVMVEMLAVGLTGAADEEPASGTLVVCLSPGAFGAEESLGRLVGAVRTRLHDSARGQPVIAPGELEAMSRAAADVIAVEDETLGLLLSATKGPS
jgi:LDH2 family malate/lactate/ureidoglycolate dehydrogenase